MIRGIYEQLAGNLTHLGEKQILVLHVFGADLRVDWQTIVMSWIVMAILVGLALWLRRGLRQPVEDKPNRAQASVDALIDLLRSQITSSFASEQLAIKLFPFVSTLFLYVLISNWLGMFPYLESPTQNLNVTLGLAFLVFFISQYLAVRHRGVKKYLKGFLEPIPVLLPMNIIGEVARPLSHAFRLFGNTLAGTFLITVIMVKFVPLAVPSILTMIFTLFFGAIQAFVFAILAVAYINVAIEE